MLKNILLLFCFLISNISLSNVIKLPEESKSEHCLRIFNKLKATKALLPDGPPFFHLVRRLPNQNFSIAMITGSNIFMDEPTYDECMKMGKEADNALAFILAHELAHFTKEHLVRHRYIEEDKADRKMELLKAVGTSELAHDANEEDFDEIMNRYEIKHNEVEADIEAGFMSYLAGYESLEAGANCLDRLYAKFNLKKEGGNYASLEERKDIVRKAVRELDTLVKVFEASNMALLVDEKEIAQSGYEYVLNHFDSPLLHNNIGASLIMDFVNNSEIDIPYKFPLVFEFKLPTEGTIVFTDDPEMMERMKQMERQRFLTYLENIKTCKKSLEHFNKAIQLNPEYHIAYLNRAITYYVAHRVQQDFDFDETNKDYLYHGIASATSAKQLLIQDTSKNKKALSDAYNVLAALHFEANDEAKAKINIEEAESLFPNRFITFINKEVINGERMAQMIMPPDGILFDEVEEQIIGTSTAHKEKEEFNQLLWDEKNIDQFFEDIQKDYQINKAVFTKNPESLFPIITSVRVFENENCTAYQWLVEKEGSEILETINLLAVKEDSGLMPVFDVTNGDSAASLVEKQGAPNRIFELPKGNIYGYTDRKEFPHHGLLYFVENEKIRQWVILKRE